MNLKLYFFVLILVFIGCKKREQQDYFPLGWDNKWVYTVRSGLQVRIDTLKVNREVYIDGTKGWEIKGPTGITSLYWHNNLLKVKYMPSLQIYPSIPILDASQKDVEKIWNGLVIFEGQKCSVKGKLKQSPDKYQEGGKNFNCLKSHLTLQFDKKNIELLTWFHLGTGIICQQQRTNNYLDISLEYLTGP